MLSFAHYPITPLVALAAVLLDHLLGEPRRYHPLVGFGQLAQALEARLNNSLQHHSPRQRLTGLLAIAMLLLPSVMLSSWLSGLPNIGVIIEVLLLYFALGLRSLKEHARAVTHAVWAGDEAQARIAASYIVSRDPDAIDPVPATLESVLENGNDGVFGALFWFLVAGGAGAVAYRLVNTLDAMWGYRSARFQYFGWAAARLDDVLNYLPARLTAITYALLGNSRLALNCWRTQAPKWESPNAGPVMAAGAGALGLKLGGSARYQGVWHERPALGASATPEVQDISRALNLINRGVALWLCLTMLAGLGLYA
jgi:adenosylcobinamide-phosphate synthase